MKRLFITLVTAIVFLASSMPSSLAADTSAPQLVDWALTVNKADISKTDATVTVRFILSDDSEIASPNLLLKSLSTTQMTSFAVVKELSRSGKLVSYEASAVIKFGQSPKVWEWVLYPLRDALGNSSTSFGPGGTWRTQISVVDANFTDDILHCEGQVNNWNKQVEKFQLLESKYSGAQEIAIVRLKFRMPIEALQVINCNNQDFRFKYVTNSTSSSNLLSAWTELANIWVNTANEIGNRIQQENEVKQAAADKAAADKVAADKAAADKAAADKAAAELKAKQEAEAKAAAELKTKQEADAKAAADKIIQDAKMEAARILAAAKATPTKKTTITCTKGKVIKKVTAIKPKCPTGYKVKK